MERSRRSFPTAARWSFFQAPLRGFVGPKRAALASRALSQPKGWAERRETFGCLRTRYARRLARRLASHNAGRSPLARLPNVVNRCSKDVVKKFKPRHAPATAHRDDVGPPKHAGNLSFRFGVRRHRLGDERPPAVSEHANIGQNLLSLFLGHFALRVRQLIEALLDLRPKLSAADLGVLL